MDIQTLEIVQTANRLVDTLGTRDPHRIARELGIEVVPVDFKRQRGAYKVLMRNRFIFRESTEKITVFGARCNS